MDTQTHTEETDDVFDYVEDTLDELSQEFVDRLIDKVLQFMEVLVGYPLHDYQQPLSRRIIESVIIGDGEEITGLAARQSGKSEIIANTVATLMVLLPRLAKLYPDLLGKFNEGFWVGLFAPTEGQAETLFGRTVSRLTSERAVEILGDPEIDDMAARTVGVTKGIRLKKSGSTLTMMTANPRAKIESKSFHLVIVDECFPYDTPVLTDQGWIRIGDIVEGKMQTLLVSTQDAAGDTVWAPIKAAYKTPRHNELLRVVHEYGTLYCTANHPFIVGDARVPASDLQPGTPLHLVQKPDQPTNPLSATATNHSDVLSGLLARTERTHAGGARISGGSRTESRIFTERAPQPQGLRVHDSAQPDASAGDSGQGVADFEADWTPPQGAGREWSGDDRATATAYAKVTSGLGRRACRVHWRAEEGRTAESLQDRRGAPGTKDRGGSGRGLARGIQTQGTRPPQDIVLGISRVVSVEVLQPEDPDWDRLGDRVDYVYTLEVDSASHTYIAAGVLVGNCQEADDFVVVKSIAPMLAYYAGTFVKTGTPTTSKNNFYRSIQLNKRRQTSRGVRQNHFEWTWKEVAKVNENYAKFIRKEMLRIGEDSDEFQMSYNGKWLLERGMFVTSSVMDELGDTSQELVKSWFRSPVVVGIDPARKTDSTVITVVWVDWDRPDEFGYFDHRVLNWLELQGDDWEDQYFQITNFLANYDVLAVGVDANGVGDAVAQRLKVLLPRAEVIPLTSSPSEQSKRWKHLQALIQRKMLGWPAHAKTRRLRSWKRFYQQMTDAEVKFKGPNITVEAPDEAHAHDDFVDSLAIAWSLTADLTLPNVEVSDNPFFR